MSTEESKEGDHHGHHEVSIIKIDNKNIGGLMPTLATCYQDVFSGSPWDEWKRCSCFTGAYRKPWPRSPKPPVTCPTCQQLLEPYWPLDEVESDLTHELSQHNAIGYVATIRGNLVVGATWAYSVEPSALEKKLELPGLANRLLDVTSGEVAYLDEIMVRMQWRNQGIAQALIAARLDEMAKRQLPYAVFRSKPGAVTHSWYQARFGFTVIAQYGGGDPREVLGAPIGQIMSMIPSEYRRTKLLVAQRDVHYEE